MPFVAELQGKETAYTLSLNAVTLQWRLVNIYSLFTKSPPAASSVVLLLQEAGPQNPTLASQHYSMKVNSPFSDSVLVNHFLCIGIF
jgi:hypothetical protein